MEFHLKELKDEIEERKCLNLLFQIHLRKVTSKNSELKTENFNLKDHNLKLKSENMNLKEENCCLISKINFEPSKKRKTCEDVIKTEKNCFSENKKIDELKHKLEELNKINYKNTKEIKDLNEKNKKFRNDMSILRKKYDDIKQTNSILESKMKNLTNILRDPRLAKNLSTDKDKKIKELEEMISSLNSKIKLKDDLTNVDLSIVKLERDEDYNYLEDIKLLESRLAESKKKSDFIRKFNPQTFETGF